AGAAEHSLRCARPCNCWRPRVVSLDDDVDRPEHWRESHSGEHAALPGRGGQARGDLDLAAQPRLGMARCRWAGALDEQARITDGRNARTPTQPIQTDPLPNTNLD